MDRSMDEQDLHDPHLDALLRPVLLVEPPPAVQQRILATVLRATAAPVAVPIATNQANATQPNVAAPDRTVSLLTYLLLGAVLVAYAALLPWIQSAMGGIDWVSTMVRQLLVAVDLLVGQPLPTEPLALAGVLVKVAPWLLLAPLAWLLWDRDRTSAEAR
jgi:hypothetical protein